jgi:hypothetical protein
MLHHAFTLIFTALFTALNRVRQSLAAYCQLALYYAPYFKAFPPHWLKTPEPFATPFAEPLLEPVIGICLFSQSKQFL